MSIGFAIGTRVLRGADRFPPSIGGYSFAEDPARRAPDATIIWTAAFDPGTLRVQALPATATDHDVVLPASLRQWLQSARDQAGEEHIALSDGWRRIRLDVTRGTLSDGPVVLRHELTGLIDLKPKLLSLRRLIALGEHHRFPAPLYPADGHVRRWIQALRVSDALQAGVPYRDIGAALFGDAMVARGWDGTTDSVRSRVRRLVREARRLAAGGFWEIMGDCRALINTEPLQGDRRRRGQKAFFRYKGIERMNSSGWSVFEVVGAASTGG